MSALKVGTRMLSLCVAFGCGGGDGNDHDGGHDADEDAGDAITVDGPGGDVPGDAGGDTDVTPSACPDGPCDLISNGCADAMACYFLQPAGGEEPPEPMCATTGAGEQGDACTTYMDCAPGFHCDGAVCRHYCCGADDTTSCPSESLCLIEFVHEDESTGAFLCRECDSCDLVDQTGCGEGLGCYIGSNDGCKLCIASVSDLTEGEACGPANDCVPGFGCFNVAPTGMAQDPRCAKFCTPGESGGCADGQDCTAVGGFDDLGACLPPASGG